MSLLIPIKEGNPITSIIINRKASNMGSLGFVFNASAMPLMAIGNTQCSNRNMIASVIINEMMSRSFMVTTILA